ncbi:CAP domain-containing protein [Tenacibaculum insulae]|uniref:CAP domain-containing protein n=1 Tax=Tenacibaculum insulae TaxID=2029677 RepID=UPI003AB15681
MFSKKHFLILLIAFSFLSCGDNSTDEIEDLENKSITQEVHQLVNEHRATIGKSALSFNDQISEMALEHTKYMINKGKISHDNSDARFTQLKTLFGATSFAENVASHQRTAKEVVTSWLNSPNHRSNIEGDFTHTGIGVSQNSSGNYYFTQLFYAK